MSVSCHPRRVSLFASVSAALLMLSAGGAVAQQIDLSAPGASEDLRERLEANSLLLRPAEEDTIRTSQDVVAAARADYGRLIGVLYEDGYFAPVITIRLDGRDAAGMSPFDVPSNISRVEIRVEPGAPFRLGRAEIGPLEYDHQLPEDFRSGGPASTPLLRATTEAALRSWQERGHATADVADQTIIARNREALLDVAITIAPGPVISFGNLIPEGQERMRIERILAIAGLPTGEVYSPAALERAEERLRETGAFSSVSLQLRDPRGNDVADVTAILDEAPLRRLGFGAEIATDDGIGLSAYWIHRNLFGGAERLRFDAAVSGLGRGEDAVEGYDAEIRARLERPATFTPDTTLRFEIAAERIDDPTFVTEGFTTEIGLSHRWSETLTVDGGLGLSFTNIDDNLGERDVSLLTLPFGAVFENRDDPLDAFAGAYAEATLTPYQPLDGGEAFLRLTLDGRAYYSLDASERTRGAARVQVGSVMGGDVLDIPPDDLFFSGGAGTVRGQEYRSLGALQNGQDSGGRSFLGLSAELRHDIGDTNFGLVGFADVGVVSQGAFGEDPSDWHAGAGIGLRYNTPFGPIRVDLAAPIEGGEGGDELFLYIGIGQAF